MATETWVAKVVDSAGNEKTRSFTITVAPPNDAMWPGHQPGQQYIGASLGNFATANLNNRLGTRRFYQQTWGTSEGSQETARANEDWAAKRIPWSSNKSPGSWAEVAAGEWDDEIEAWASRQKSITSAAKPMLFTFHHEPFGDSNGNAASFVAAFHQVMDIYAAVHVPYVTLCPILHGHNILEVGDDWLSDDMVENCGLIGFDTYRPLTEIQAQVNYFVSRGVRRSASPRSAAARPTSRQRRTRPPSSRGS